MAHLVRYITQEGDRFAPSVSRTVPSKHNAPDDVMLVSALLYMRYTGPMRIPLPRGASHVLDFSPKYTAQTHLFVTDFQKYKGLRPSGISQLPVYQTDGLMKGYTMFLLYDDIVSLLGAVRHDPDPWNTILQKLKSLPGLNGLDSLVYGEPPQTNPVEVIKDVDASGNRNPPSGTESGGHSTVTGTDPSIF